MWDEMSSHSVAGEVMTGRERERERERAREEEEEEEEEEGGVIQRRCGVGPA